jgi:hypothetical protein
LLLILSGIIQRSITNPTHLQAATDILQHVPQSLSAQVQAELERPFSFAELKHAINAMATQKSLGPDGCAIELYSCLWETIGKDFLQMINDSFRRGRFPDEMNHGLIALFHKGGEREGLGN